MKRKVKTQRITSGGNILP